MASTKKTAVATTTRIEVKPTGAKTVPVTGRAKPTAGKKVVRKTGTSKAALEKAITKHPVSKTSPAPKTAKTTVKAKKPKLVRDSFTIPKAEFAVIEALKQRAAKLTRPVKKSELLRAGIKVLATLSNAAFLTALDEVPALKTGRPTLN